MKALLLVSYDGTAFSGWQRQPNARTVQEEMEEAAYRAFSRRVTLTASGRMDAGVHALGGEGLCGGEGETNGVAVGDYGGV